MSAIYNITGGSDGKEPACYAGDLGLIPRLERSPRRGHGNPLQYSCLEDPHGQRSLEGYSPRRCKELDMTERLHSIALTKRQYSHPLSRIYFPSNHTETYNKIIVL